MDKIISRSVQKIPPSGIREFFDLVLGMPDVISLGVGEPDFVTPWRIREKAITALEEGYTSYTSNKGLQVLREEIAAYLKRKYGLVYNADSEVLITVGVSEGFDLALRALINPGDKVIVVSPHYVAYPALVQLNGGVPLYLATRQEEGFKIKVDRLEKLLKHRPKLLILNYPCNPTGATYSRSELMRIARLLRNYNTVIVSDEIYHDLTYSGKHTPFAALGGMRKRTVMLNGFSKGEAMTGFRIGYACGPRGIISAMTKIHAFSMLCAPIISQIAAQEALRAREEVAAMRRQYHKRRDFMVQELNRLGLTTLEPEGAFYCFASIKITGKDSLQFAKELLFQEKVAVVPGRAFGDEYDDFVRISFASTLDKLKESVIRIERFLNSK